MHIQYPITIIYTKIQISIFNFHRNMYISQNKRWALIKRRKMHIRQLVKFSTNFQMVIFIGNVISYF